MWGYSRAGAWLRSPRTRQHYARWHHASNYSGQLEGGVRARMTRAEMLKHPFGKRWFDLVIPRDRDGYLKNNRAARDGHVLSLVIDTGAAIGRFDENYGYDQTEAMILFPPWTSEQQAQWFAMLQDNLAWSMALLRHELPEALLARTEELGMPLIPANDQQLSFTCTCFRSRTFCKHQAATWFVMANELIAHPLLYAQLYGVPVQTTVEHIIDHPLYDPFAPLASEPESSDPVRFWQGGALPVSMPSEATRLGEPLTALGRFPCWHGQYDPADYLSPIYKVAPEFAAQVLEGKVVLQAVLPDAAPPYDEDHVTYGDDDDDPFITITRTPEAPADIEDGMFAALQRDGISIELLKRMFGRK